MSVLESAVIVAVPEAEGAVSSWRARLDPAAGWGVPAHITVLYPFLPPGEIDDAVLESLAAAIAAVPAFDCTLARVSWFGAAVVWLDPDPAGPFRELTAGVWRSFPRCPPYGGRHDEPIPHLTVGDSAPLADLRAAERSVQALLPIPARVTMARLICGSMEPNSWHTITELPLGAAGG
jgi:2'-5' RNA ligase